MTAGGRVLAVRATGTDVADARAKAYEGISSISFPGAQWRRDIAAEPLGVVEGRRRVAESFARGHGRCVMREVLHDAQWASLGRAGARRRRPDRRARHRPGRAARRCPSRPHPVAAPVGPPRRVDRARRCSSCAGPATGTPCGSSSTPTAPSSRWYVNFETPYVRTRRRHRRQRPPARHRDRSRRRRGAGRTSRTSRRRSPSGRITQDELLAVLAAAADVAELLDRGDRWWAPWDDWTPADGTIGS